MIARSHVVAAAAIICGAAAAAQQPVRDNAPIVAGTASISGTVFVDGASKQPARRARVTLTNVARTSPGQTTTTDERGAFFFGGLSAGRFELDAFKPGYLKGSYGASRPNRAGTPIVVKDAQALTDLALTIARGGVIAGVVRDNRGRPVPGATVRVLKLGYNAATGERTLGAPSSWSESTTDDRGEYRTFGLPPGGYLVLVPGPGGRAGGQGVGDLRQLTTDEVRRALQAARGGTPISSQPGQPPSVSPSSPRVDYAPVFHPGVTDISSAATIALDVSQQRTGIDVTVHLVRTATISGKVTSPAGALPQFLSIRLVPAGAHTEMLAGAGLRGLSAQPAADGSYSFTGVAPGSYTVKALVGYGRGAPPPNTPTMWAAADVNVGGHDLEVPLTLQPGVPINGRVVFEGSQPTAAELQTLSFRLIPYGSGGALLPGGGGQVDAEGRFSFASVAPDIYQFVFIWNTPGAGEKWTIKSSATNGRDAFENPLRVNANETLEWTVTYTDKPTTLTGVFQDRAGRAATDYYILVFSSDRQHWIAGSRRIRMVRPATDGAFSVKGLPPGEYVLAALTDLETGEWNDPTLLDQLVPAGITVTLRDGQTTKQDFRIGG